jgi:hypothetical protein
MLRSELLMKRLPPRLNGTARVFSGILLGGVEGAVGAQILTAVYILLGAIFVPIGIKLMFFYVIAPWASRRPPDPGD